MFGEDFLDHLILGHIAPLGPDGAGEGLHQARQITASRLDRGQNSVRRGRGVHWKEQRLQIQLHPQAFGPPAQFLHPILFAAFVAFCQNLAPGARKQRGAIQRDVAN